MTVTNVSTDTEARTLTITASFAATTEEVWRLWADPRLLERWWGPPTYPATVVEHDLTPGGRVTYYMTGPSGDRPRGWWRVIAVDPPSRLEFEDGFADAEGNPDPSMPTMTAQVTIEPQGDAQTVMTIRSAFASAEAMAQILAMGAAEGMTEAMAQIDVLLAEARATS
jgi:uncharacterized protein YndB with AHSA1/START domain